MSKLLYLITEDSYFISHRLELALYAKQQGCEVAIATRCLKHREEILKQGLQLFELKFFNRSNYLNPIKEILALKELYFVYKKFKPDIVHQVALKPIVYGTIIGRILKIPKIINAIAGLGFVFTEYKKTNYFKLKILIKQKILKIIIKILFKMIFLWLYRSNDILLLQNQDDLVSLKEICKINDFDFKVFIIYGSGLNIHKYLKVQPLNILDFKQDIKIVMLSRLLWTKGVYEFVDAALLIKKYLIKYNLKINPIFILYGDIDKQNPATINYQELELWQSEGLIIWRNFSQDIASAYQDAHIVVLPSYREGLPKSLLEALACARAIVTTDVPGCREVVEHGINGYLVPKQDSFKLADVLLSLIQAPELIINMGNAGREIAHKKFSNQIILPKIFDLYKQ